MRPKSHVRKTVYGDLNRVVWNYFKECQDAGVVVNGKHLRDIAMKFASDMGLDAFKGSEGWLDAFKRRHMIELKTMTGYPVCYESGPYEEAGIEAQRQQKPQADSLLGSGVSNFPDDFANSLFNNLNGMQQQQAFTPQSHEPTTSNAIQNMINSMITSSPPLFADPTRVMDNSDNMMFPSFSTPQGSSNQTNANQLVNSETFKNVMRSCQIKVNNKEVSQALDTLRSFILAHDQSAMGMLVELQERLALCPVKSEDIVSSSTSA